MVGCPFNPLKVRFLAVACCGVCLEGNQLEGRDFVGLPTLGQAHVFVSFPMKKAKRGWRIVRLHGLQVRFWIFQRFMRSFGLRFVRSGGRWLSFPDLGS